MGVKKFLKVHRIPLFIFSIISILYILPIFFQINSIGIQNWDLWIFYNEAARKSIIEFHQLPLWNPYYCGGNILLSQPESQVFSPTFLLVLLLGTILGIKIAILLHFFIGLLGMYLLCRHFKLSMFPSIAASVIYMMSAIFAMRIAVGHFSYLVMGFYPLAFLFFLKSSNKLGYAVASAFFLALAFFNGSIYELSYFILFIFLYGILKSISEKNYTIFFNAVLIFMLFFFISSVKLIPLLDFVHDNPREATFSIDEGTSLSDFFDNILKSTRISRYYNPENPATPDSPRWWEGIIGMGVFGLLLVILGLFKLWTNDKSLIISLFVFIAISLGSNFPINLWKIIHYLPLFDSFYVIGRINIVLLFGFSILAGYGFSIISTKIFSKKLATYLSLGFVIFLIWSLWIMNQQLLFDVNSVQVPDVERSAVFYQTINTTKYDEEYPKASSSSHYLSIKKNMGDLTCLEEIRHGVSVSAVPREYADYKGEVYLLSEGKAELKYFSPRKLVIDIYTDKENILVLNQNYGKSWSSSAGKPFNYRGLTAVNVPAGATSVEFSYFPDRFIIGVIFSLLSIIFATLFIREKYLRFTFIILVILFCLALFYIYGLKEYVEIPKIYYELSKDNQEYSIIQLPLTTPLPHAFSYYNEHHNKKILWHHPSQKLAYDIYLIKKIFWADDPIDAKHVSDILIQDPQKLVFSILSYENVKKIILHKKWYGSHVDWLILSGPASPYNYSRYQNWYSNELYNKTKKFLDEEFVRSYEDEDVIVYDVIEKEDKKPFMLMEDGWYWQEVDADGTKYGWIGDESSIKIISFGERKVNLNFTIPFIFYKPRKVDIYLENRLIGRHLITDHTEISLNLLLKNGENVLKIRTDGCTKPYRVSSNKDRRCLSIALSDIELKSS